MIHTQFHNDWAKHSRVNGWDSRYDDRPWRLHKPHLVFVNKEITLKANT
jgi:hypothetical protein